MIGKRVRLKGEYPRTATVIQQVREGWLVKFVAGDTRMLLEEDFTVLNTSTVLWRDLTWKQERTLMDAYFAGGKEIRRWKQTTTPERLVPKFLTIARRTEKYTWYTIADAGRELVHAYIKIYIEEDIADLERENYRYSQLSWDRMGDNHPLKRLADNMEFEL